MAILRYFLWLCCVFLSAQLRAQPPEEWSASLLPSRCSEWLEEAPGARTYRYLLGRHEVDGVNWQETLNVVEYETDGPLMTTRYFRTLEPYATDGSLATPVLPSSEYLKKVRSIRDFANAKYRYRRPWPETFLTSMEDDTESLLHDTIASETILKATGTRVASILFYLAPYGIVDGQRVAAGHFVRKHYGPVTAFRTSGATASPGELALPPSGIPETELLGITHPFPPELKALRFSPEIASALDVEIAAFVVEEDLAILSAPLRAQAWLECFGQLMLTAFDRSDYNLQNYYAKNFYVPADNRSQIMYRALFLQLQRAYLKDGEWVLVEETEVPPAISAYETDWRAMVFHPLNILKFAQSIVQGETSPLLPKFDSGRFVRRMEELGLDLFLPDAELSIEPDESDELARISLFDYLRPLYEGRGHFAVINALSDASVGFADRRAAAQTALDQVAQRASRVRDQLPQWVAEQSEAVRAGVAWMPMGLLDVPDEVAGPLSPAVILKTVVTPLLVDSSSKVRFDALYGLRFSYTRDRLLMAFGFTPDSLKPVVGDLGRQLRSDLIAGGLSETKINWWIGQIRGFIPYTRREPHQHWSRTDYHEMKQELGTPPLLGNPALVEKLLLLGILYPTLLSERALNTIPYPD